MVGPSRRRVASFAALAFAAALDLFAQDVPSPAHASKTPAPPKLVVLIVVDQCRPDYFERFAPRLDGFFARLREEGRWFTDAEQHHAITVTAAGHAAIGTGRFPSRSGIVGNEFFDPEEGRLVGAANDRAAEKVGGEGGGYSPRRLLCDGLADWWKRRWPEGKAIGVSVKPRSAIFPMGKGGSAAYWVDEPTGRMVTSAYYRKDPAPWAVAFEAGDPLGKLPQTWETTLGDAAAFAALGCTADDQPGEALIGANRSRSFPHSLAAPLVALRTQFVLFSPFADELLLEFARAAVAGEQLGEDDAPDLLVLGLSATDYIGHRCGPDSWEIAEQFVHLDHLLARFMDELEAKTDGRLLVALTSDHGVAPLPEVAKARGKPGARVDWGSLKPIVAAALASIAPPLADAALPMPEYALRLDPKKVAESGRSLEEVADALAAKLRADPTFVDARSRFELARPLADGDRIGELLRNSSDGARAGDLLFVLPPGSIYYAMTGSDAQMALAAATSHGTPHPYDTSVPLVFWGPAVKAGRVAGRAWTVDVAPTLATAVGIPLPPDLDGRPLELSK
jgi:hypothetical protein